VGTALPRRSRTALVTATHQRLFPLSKNRKHFPSADDILKFVKDSSTPATKRELSRAFQIQGQDRVAFKQLLKKMLEDGMIAQTAGKSYALPEGLPDVTTVKITEIGGDGEWLAVPEKWHGAGR